MKKPCITIGILAFALTLLFLMFANQPVSAKKDNRLRIAPLREQPFVPNRVLVKFKSNIGLDHARQIIAALGVRDADELPQLGIFVLDLPAQADEAAFANALQNRPDVEFAELDRLMQPSTITPNDPWYPNEWHLAKISAPTAWSTSVGNSAVVVAILDTGVDSSHPDLAPKMVAGWNTYDNNSDTTDVAGHGTIVAGTVGAESNNAQGVASIAWGCRLMPIRVSDPSGYGLYSTAASGLTWAADHGARVAQLSYNFSTSSTVASAAEYFQDKGGVVVTPAGNNGTFDSSQDSPYFLRVSATDGDDVLYSWSNTGNNIDLAAPGYVITTVRGGGYSGAAGTSVASPIVAGVAALVFSVSPNLTPAQVQTLLKQSADDLGLPGWDAMYGNGRINAARALSVATATTPADTTPPTVRFSTPTNGSTINGTIPVSVTATDNVAVASVTLLIDGIRAATSTAPLDFAWQTTQAGNGIHNLTAIATDSAGNAASVTISVMVNNVVDVTPPVVNLTSPKDGDKLATNVSVSVTASDNVAITRVELYVDGRLQASSTNAPFTIKWNTSKAAKGLHSLQCRAYDAANNVGESQTVSVVK